MSGIGVGSLDTIETICTGTFWASVGAALGSPASVPDDMMGRGVTARHKSGQRKEVLRNKDKWSLIRGTTHPHSHPLTQIPILTRPLTPTHPYPYAFTLARTSPHSFALRRALALSAFTHALSCFAFTPRLSSPSSPSSLMSRSPNPSDRNGDDPGLTSVSSLRCRCGRP